MAKKKSNAPNYKRDAELFWNRGAKNMYNEFKKIGLSDYQIAGLLGSIGLESSFDHTATNGSHWGYVQNSKDLVDSIKKFYGGYGHNEQMKFLIDGLSGRLKGASGKNKDSTMVMLQQRFNNYLNKTKNITDPRKTASFWETEYEKSGGQAMGARQEYSNHFYNLMGNSGNVPLNNNKKVQKLEGPNLINITQPNDAIRVLPRPNLNIRPVAQIDNTPIMYNDLSTPITPSNVGYNNYAYTKPIYNTQNIIPVKQKAFNTETPEVILPNFDFYNLNLGDYLNDSEYFT